MDPDLADKLAVMRHRIEMFQDCWEQHRAEQFVAADYELVCRAIRWIGDSQPVIGKRFLEWGCGFAAFACLAESLGWSVHAVEAHPDLVCQAQQTIRWWPAKVDLVTGNFLPPGAEQLTADPTLPSLGHGGTSAYEQWGLDLDDFDLIYSYPWPGEDTFHEDVFDRYAAHGALLLMFVGPNELKLWRKCRRNLPKSV